MNVETAYERAAKAIMDMATTDARLGNSKGAAAFRAAAEYLLSEAAILREAEEDRPLIKVLMGDGTEIWLERVGAPLGSHTLGADQFGRVYFGKVLK